MVQITVSSTEAIRIGGDFFSEYVVLPAPVEYLNRQEAEHVTLGIFSKMMRMHGMYDENGFEPVCVDTFIDRVKSILINDISDELMYHDEPHDEVKNIVTDVIDNGTVPDNKTGMIYCEHVMVQLTRLITQNVYDAMRETQTHLHVDNPLDPNNEKWDEVTPLPHNETSITMNVRATKAVEVTGSVFAERVIIPIPNTVFIAEPEAKAVTEIMFEWVCEYINDISKNGFTGVKSKGFITDLHYKLKEVLTEECDKVSAPSEEDIDDVLRPVFPDDVESIQLPAEIWAEGVLVHITRMVLQTVFDSVLRSDSHMGVDNPFAVREHKWDEITI